MIQFISKNSLFRNSLALAANSLFASILGFIFWWLAARILSTETIGLASGLISAAILLATAAQLGLGYGVIKWYAESNNKTHLINLVLSWGGVTCLIFTTIFIIGLPIWSPKLLFIQNNIDLSLAFITLALLLNLTQLLDSVFIATRHSEFLVTTNSLISVLRVMLLGLFSWLIGKNILGIMLVFDISLGVIFLLSIGWFLPQAMTERYQPFVVFQGLSTNFMKYSLSNHVANFLQQLPNQILPILALNLFGSIQTAHFFIPWIIASGLSAVAAAGSLSLFAEGANDIDNVEELFYQTVTYSLIISLFIAIGLIIIAFPLLSIYGNSYAAEATPLLYILAIAIIPTVMNLIYFSKFRIQARLKPLIIGQTTIVILSISLAYGLGLLWGLWGVGLAWLIAQGVVFIFLRINFFLK